MTFLIEVEHDSASRFESVLHLANAVFEFGARRRPDRESGFSVVVASLGLCAEIDDEIGVAHSEKLLACARSALRVHVPGDCERIFYHYLSLRD